MHQRIINNRYLQAMKSIMNIVKPTFPAIIPEGIDLKTSKKGLTCLMVMLHLHMNELFQLDKQTFKEIRIHYNMDTIYIIVYMFQ